MLISAQGFTTVYISMGRTACLFVYLLYLFTYGVCRVAVEEDFKDSQTPCSKRSFGHSSFVCVCNATYCDNVPSTSPPPVGEYLILSSDILSKRFHRSQGTFDIEREGVGDSRETADFTLNPQSTFQTVIGWGGAFTDAAAKNILSLSASAQELLLRSYFAEDGIEYNLGRVNMGGCDFSWRTYTYADTQGDDDTLESFALQPEDLEYKIPVIQRASALSARPLKLFGSPWTAPPWMKTNNDYIGYGQLKEEMYQPWAEYFVKFIDNYKANNVTIWGLTAQNEPLDGYIPGFSFNCMGWTADSQRKWIANNLGPTLEAHGHGDVILMIMDDQRIELPEWPQTVLSDPLAAKYVDGIGVHWYIDDYISPERLTETHELFPDYFILGTEACDGEGPLEEPVALGSWERLENYAHDIIVDMNHWVTGWTDWNLALDTQGGPNWVDNFVDSPIIVNKTADEFYKNPMFYAMGHFSKFIHEYAVRIELTSPDPHHLETTAFRNTDGTQVLVILNRSEAEVEARVEVPDRGIMVLTIGGRSLNTAVFV